MAGSDFVHLHLHSEYSLLDGACRIDELLDRVVQLGMPAAAITEHGNMFSSIVFHDQARKRGLNPILGCEVYVAPGDRRTKSGTPGETANHLVLLAETREGYHNLIKLVSSGYTEGFYYKPRIDKELLAQHATGLIGLSSCLKGEVATGIRREQQAKALSAAAAYRDILGPENFFLEMQYQGIDEQKIVNVGLQPIAKDLNLNLVVTNDVHYLDHSDSKPHDILLCIGTGKTVADADRLKYHGDQFYLKTAEEMAKVFQDFPEALANTVRIAERCNVDLSGTVNHLPNFDVPAGFTLDDYFEHIVREGFQLRLPRLKELQARGVLKHTIDEYERRLSYEIDVIKQMKYPGYFCITWDFIRHAREQGIPVGPGRGSAAGSFVAYCLRITDVDPMAYDLIFERFLNPERVSLPDIDIDFCERRRGEVIEYVTRKYGRENVAQIITFGTMKARAVVRDVARVMDIPYADADRVAKAVPPALDMTLAKALEESPPLKELQKDPRIRELLEVAQRLEGMTRHASVHAAGVVIAPRPLTEFVPLYKSQKDEIVTQWAMKEVERVGLLKMDFLGLSTLTLICDALAEIKRTENIVLDIDAIPLDDAKTYKLFGDGQTYGVFQFESSGMRELLRKAKPERLDDLIALNALYRPGPLKSGMVDDFISRKQGKTEVKYELPQLAPILSDTYGVIAYQEQVMRIAAVLAGFSMGQSDVLRKAMGKKDPKVMAKQREAFMAGAINNKVNEKKAAKIFDLMEFFAGYGFNKSHSTTYAWIAYQTGYLKANFPWHFMAALLTIEAANTDKLAMYLGECRELGIPILQPDINKSQLSFTVEKEGVRFGLCAVKNVGEGAILSMLNVRKELGRVDSLFTLCEHVDQRLVNKRPLESLVKAGAFDSLADGPIRTRRARLFIGVDKAIEHGSRSQRNKLNGTVSFFDLPQDDEPPVAIPLPDAAPWTEALQLASEKEALGLYMSGHPLERFAEELKTFGAKRLAELTGSEPDLWLGGIVSGLRPLKTKKGDRMCVFMLDDIAGSLEVVVFPETFGKHGSLVEADAMLLVRGKFEKDDESARMVATELLPIAALKERTTREVVIHLSGRATGRPTFEALAELLTRHRGDRRVFLELDVKSQEKPLRVRSEVAQRVRPSERLVLEVEQICGAGSVELRYVPIAMPAELLEFEEPVGVLLKEIEALSMLPQTPERQRSIESLRRRADEIRTELFANLTPWQRVLVARHSARPNTLDYVNTLFTGFDELHGDRRFADDHAIVCGFAEYKRQPVCIVGHQKGSDTKQKIFRNFGYARPEGYRKALRVMQLAQKFSRPIVVFIDTPAAFPGVESEERGVAEAIAFNLREMMMLEVPIVIVVCGEGGSGGALGIAIGDRVLMQEYAVYSVIPPEGCAAILWRDSNRKVEAAAALKITAPDLLQLGLIDEIIPEPAGGAHNDPARAGSLLDEALARTLSSLTPVGVADRLAARYDKFRRMGREGEGFIDTAAPRPGPAL